MGRRRGKRSLARCRVIAQRIGLGQIEGHAGEHRRAAAGRGLDVERAADDGGPFPHPDQADHRVRDRRGIEADAVVFDRQRQGAATPLQDDADGLCTRMSGDVVQCFLRDAIHRRLDFRGDPLISEPFDVKPRLHIRVPRPFTDVVLEHRFQAELVECCGAQFPRQKVDIAVDAGQERFSLRQRRLHVGQAGRDGTNRLEFQAE